MGNYLCFVRSNSKGDFIDLEAMTLEWVLIDSDFPASRLQANAHSLVVGLQCNSLGLALILADTSYISVHVSLFQGHTDHVSHAATGHSIQCLPI